MASAVPTNSPVELKERIHTANAGHTFLCHRSGEGAQVITILDPAAGRLIVGRGHESGLDLTFDTEVSRLHAVIEPLGGDWVLSDEGFSRNGSFVNGERVVGRRRLRDGDEIRFGSTGVLFFHPGARGGEETVIGSSKGDAPELSVAQRRVLVALCRPYGRATEFAVPATNGEIAEELFLGIETVKSHLRVLFDLFVITDVQPGEKRIRLVEQALRSGAVSRHELLADGDSRPA